MATGQFTDKHPPVLDAIDTAREAREGEVERLQTKLRKVAVALGIDETVANSICTFYSEPDKRFFVELDHWEVRKFDKEQVDRIFSRLEDALNPEDAEIYPASIDRVGNGLALVVQTDRPYSTIKTIDDELKELCKDAGVDFPKGDTSRSGAGR